MLIPFVTNEITENALPLKLFEYMACGKPIIATPIEPIKRLVGENVLYATTEHEYAEIINKLYENDKQRTKLGTNGRTISENYSWEKITLKLDNLLRTVAHGDNNENMSIEPSISEEFC